MGGLSSEREISLRSGQAVIAALEKRGYRPISIDAGRDLPTSLRQGKVEIAFIALHGKYGEDGSVQGLLEWLQIPYTGSGVLASALGMNKIASRRIFEQAGLRVPTSALLFKKGEAPPFPFPVVVKPIAEGSSVGVGLVQEDSQWNPALFEALKYGSPVLVEKFIESREVHVGILEDQALGGIEVVPQRGLFYDYESKYAEGGSVHRFPAPLPVDRYQEVLQVGLQAHRALGCQGYSRVDCLIDRSDQVFVLEVNTLPGLTSVSLLPEIAQGVGISFEELVERILLQATLD
ncbi:MAG: D-alanine--D-alanine ligase [Deltaproteobacteria bacterium]|nr:D-alanine--D-alanine ligase [Deltaproteobacteria bacterium]